MTGRALLVVAALAGCSRSGALPDLDRAPRDRAGADSGTDSAADRRAAPEQRAVDARRADPCLSSAAGWAVAAGGAGASPSVNAVAGDPTGASYVAGRVTGSASFGGKALNDAAFVTKLDPQGSFLWVLPITGSDGGAWPTGLAVEASGHSYVAGSFGSAVSVGNVALTAPWLGLFVARLTPQGAVAWAVPVTFDGPQPPGCRGFNCALHAAGLIAGRVAVDGAGHLYLTGSLRGPASFGAQKVQPDEALFVAKLDAATGAFLWVALAPTAGTIISGPRAIAVDAAGGVYLAGTLDGETSFGTTRLAYAGCPSTMRTSLFAAKLDGQGDFVWAHSGLLAHGSVEAEDLVADAAGNGFLAGRAAQLPGDVSCPGYGAAGTLTLGSLGAGTVKTAVTFVAKHDSAGSFLWAALAEGSSASSPSSLALDCAGTVYLAGSLVKAGSFGPVTLPAPNGVAAFVAEVNPAGAFVTATASGSSATAAGLATDGRGRLRVGGTFAWPTLFGATRLQPAGPLDGAAHDLFLWEPSVP